MIEHRRLMESFAVDKYLSAGHRFINTSIFVLVLKLQNFVCCMDVEPLRLRVLVSSILPETGAVNFGN